MSIARSEPGSHRMPKDNPKCNQRSQSGQVAFFGWLRGHLVVIGGRDCKLPENEGHGENRVRMTVLGMPQMSQMGPISKSCLFWVVTWPLGVEVAIQRKANY